VKIEGRLFLAVGIFLFVVTGVYWLLSKDPTGTALLLLSGGLGAMIAFFLLFTAGRMDPRPEDRADAEISDGAGELGFFSPHSYWPITVAAGAGLTGLGVIFGTWLMLLGLVLVVVTATGFLFEYYVGR
jgi:hypothetical protein